MLKSLSCLFFFLSLLLAGEMEFDFILKPNSLILEEKDGFIIPHLADEVFLSEPGNPLLPQVPVNLLIPPDAEGKSVEAIPIASQEFSLDKKIYPAQPPRPISYKGEIPFTSPTEAVYSLMAEYPNSFAEGLRTGTKSGWRISSFLLNPVRYLPKENKLVFYYHLRVKVNYDLSLDYSPTPITPSQKELFIKEVKSIVKNPEDAERYAPPLRFSDNPDVDYVIITTNALSTYWDNFKTWKTKKGFYTEVKTTEWISSTYPGRDLQEKIRNFIIDYWRNQGLKYVLLAGDNSVVPCRRARAVVSPYTGNIPCDLYFADLQWSWDGDRDNIFGEADGDTVDFYADLYVGRASVENQTEINTFINKVLTYEKTPVSTAYLKRILLPSVNLFTGYHGRIVNDTISNITPAGWTDQHLIDPSGTSPMKNALDTGYAFCHASAHGDDVGLYHDNGSAIYTTTQAAQQTNGQKLTILNSIACYPGNFETSDCLAEELMKNANGGCVAVIMNSRYGFGQPPSMGPSEKLDVRFYDFFFNYDSFEIGVAHSRAKDYYAGPAGSQQVWRWCVFELNLFGDPEMAMWSDMPQTMQVLSPETIYTGPRTVRVTVTSGGNPLPNALVCLYKAGEVHSKGKTNTSGWVDLVVNAQTPGQIFLTVTAKNRLPVEKTIPVATGAPAPLIVYQSVYIDDAGQANPNNRLDPGEAVNLWVTLKNIGNLNATNVTGKLRTASSYITRLDSTSSYGQINQGDTARGDNYRISASSSTPPGSVINFTVFVSADQGTWEVQFSLTVGQPQMPGTIVADHDTGYCKLTVTCLGSIGYDAPAFDLGSGFRYPKSAASVLYFGGHLAGNSESYIVDRFYGRPASTLNTDWRLVDSVRLILPPLVGDEHYRAIYNDAAHSTPKGLKVYQNSYMSAQPGYDDFIILAFDYENAGSQAINGLYSGIICDFDISTASPPADYARTISAKRVAMMRNSTTPNPCVGIKLLYPTTARNLSVIDHDRFVYPDSAMSEGMKWRFLNGTYSFASSNRAYDWSICVSAGPFDLPVGFRQRVAYAIVGGSDSLSFLANCDSAQSFYDRFLGVSEEKKGDFVNKSSFYLYPNPARSKVYLAMDGVSQFTYEIYDCLGKKVNSGFAHKPYLELPLRNLPPGVYFLKIKTNEREIEKRLVILK
ncbi:MAG: C25 family cysteine peptidase [candidate division WOR-3 bacterium]